MSVARVSSWLRTLHRTAALFLTPWVLMYAVSTLVMNHRDAWLDSPRASSLELLRTLHKNGAFEAGSLRHLPWAVSVDLFAFSMLLWLASGAWLWWRMPATRRSGGAALLLGLSAFALFAASI